jgi:hypothetical protein
LGQHTKSLFVFICSSFYDAFSVTIASNGREVSE